MSKSAYSLKEQTERWRAGLLWYSVGPLYRGKEQYVVCYCKWWVTVTRLNRDEGTCDWSESFQLDATDEVTRLGEYRMASKYLKQAIGKRENKTRLQKAGDPFLVKERPALAEFLLELESEPGKPREPSVLMIAMSEDGVRVGLKDEDAGGWLWREGITVADALDTLEKALQAGNCKWSGGQSRAAKGKGRKGG